MAPAQKLGLTPEENETSRAIRAGGDKNLATLKTLSGAAFDKAYVDHEVVYHAQVLDAIDTTLIPGASNGELKALLACSVSVGTALFVRTPVTHTIVIEGMQFTPTRLTIRPGDSVTWVNKEIVAHTATTPASAKRPFDSGMLAVGQSWTRSFTAAGSYDYICTYHPTMTGVIEVAARASVVRRPRR